MPLIFSAIIVTILWNIVWVCGSSIQLLEQRSLGKEGDGCFSEYDLSAFDRIMYRGDCAWNFLIYQIMIIAVPIDLCKTQQMKANVRIYALLFSLMVSIKLTIQGLVFDNYLNQVIVNDFIQLRFLVIIISIFALVALVPLFVDEMAEIISNVRNKRQLRGQIAAVKERLMQKEERRREREAGKRRRRVVQHDRLRRYGAYSDGSSNLLNPYRTPSSQEPAGQVANNALWARRESFDSY